MYNSLERSLFRCSVIDKQTERYIYPVPSDESIMLMSLKSNAQSKMRQVFGFLRTNLKGDKYLEIIFYNERILHLAHIEDLLFKGDICFLNMMKKYL